MSIERLRRVAEDLWETSIDRPFPGLTTHAYLWTAAPAGNVLFYSVATDAQFDELDDLGGVAHQYLSHRFATMLTQVTHQRADAGRFVQDRDDDGNEVIHSSWLSVIGLYASSPPLEGSKCLSHSQIKT